MNKIILSSIVFSFMFLTNVFATKQLEVRNSTNEKIKYELTYCFIRPNKIKHYKGILGPKASIFLSDNIISVDKMKVVIVNAKPAAENKIKIWEKKLYFGDNESRIIKIYKKDGKLARKIYKKY